MVEADVLNHRIEAPPYDADDPGRLAHAEKVARQFVGSRVAEGV